jgi:hypothetical protein
MMLAMNMHLRYQVTAEERQHGYFQQDSATAHTANATMVAIREMVKDLLTYLCTELRPS